MPAELSEADRRFVDEYLIDLNGTQAYRRAHPGTSAKTARTMAARLLAKVGIKAEIAAARHDFRRQHRVSADRVLRELARIAFSDILDAFDFESGQLLPLSKVPFDGRRAIAGVKARRGKQTRRWTEQDGTKKVEVVEVSQVVEVRLWDKLHALDRLARHLGLDTEITPLDALLAALPSNLADQVRAAMQGRQTV